MMPEINKLDAIEMLDSRGCLTLAVTVALSSGAKGIAKVPLGASAVAHEGVELRDGDKLRYSGMGELRAILRVSRATVYAASTAQAQCAGESPYQRWETSARLYKAVIIV